jgi:serine/threonine-protein kinase HipA
LESPRRRSLSLSLPISGSLETRGQAVRNYFDNLLPDNDGIRSRLRRRFRLKSDEIFDLLDAIGRDCVGAVQLLADDASPEGWDRIHCESLSEEQIVDQLRAVASDTDPESIHDDHFLRISIAGAQEKTALTRWKGKWCRPHGTTPTTHIIKLPLGLIGGSKRVDAADSVQNEWLCTQIVAALGLPVAPTSLATFGGQAVLIVERFDRERMDDGTWIARLPLEDLCQALGVGPDQKYEQHGGPGMQKCLQLLQGSADRDDTTFFLLTQLAFVLMAATDGHAKNFAIHLDRGDAYRMTPVYDILSMWPHFGDGDNQFRRRKAGLAMAARSKSAHDLFHTIEARHWQQRAARHGGNAVWHAMIELVSSVDGALAKLERRLPQDFPARAWESVSTGMRGEAKRFLAEAELLAPG